MENPASLFGGFMAHWHKKHIHEKTHDSLETEKHTRGGGLFWLEAHTHTFKDSLNDLWIKRIDRHRKAKQLVIYSVLFSMYPTQITFYLQSLFPGKIATVSKQKSAVLLMT